MNGEILGNTQDLAQRLIAKTYQKVTIGLIITGLVMAFMATFMRNFIMSMGLGTSLIFLVIMLALMFMLSRSISNENSSPSTANAIYYTMTVLFGVSVSPLLVIYNINTIGLAMLATAVMFGGLTYYANHTKKDYIPMSIYLFWGLLAAIVLSVVAVFIRVPGFYLLIDVIMLVIFAFYIIVDTQSVKRFANQVSSEAQLEKFSTLGALNIYLDVLNLFEILVELIGMGQNNNN
ncbi:Bax inhibitor-1 family protein [Fructilactobacillus cliffordii]|uniref:Bax inhibitor-1 family protein n=1 Tax=Fructilactobacillus cliffordii TaxID=2940299 RepID=A0A9Q8ZUP0_9LACO|nr:Bax inhibitor-1 family protein [Fructilactobacillus cliffordii]USS86733.1 Bax inhibitor-1 family protein [Fructilactobacillus cliffordii]USS89730.1 Bax inhibitor-1 family protein [Fructilactobacillus cliffordii]